MASKIKKNTFSKDKLPNLKICVDNTVESSSSSSESSEEGEISEDESEVCVEPISESPTELDHKSKSAPTNRKLASPVQSEEENDLNADLDDLETFGVTKPKKKENIKTEKKFELGFDPVSKESQEKRKERARRFGTDSKVTLINYSSDDVKKLYTSLGVSSESTRLEKGIRLDTIHMQGVDEMNTQDIINYFGFYSPVKVEWIDRTSCNVIWEEDQSAARAVLSVSDDPQQAQQQLQELQQKSGNTEESMDTEENKSQSDRESDPDDLDLLSSDDEDSGRRRNRKNKQNEKTDKEKMETDDQPDSIETKAEEGNKELLARLTHVEQAARIMPPGVWRVGRPLPNNKYLFIRFAAKADRKIYTLPRDANQPRANYGSRTLMSRSRRQAIIAARNAEVDAEAEKILANRPQNRQKEFFRRRKLRTQSSDEEDEFEPRMRSGRGGEATQRGRSSAWSRLGAAPARPVTHYEDLTYDEPEEYEEDYRPRPQTRLEDIRIERRLSGSEGEELDMQAELDELLRHELPETRKMRMYADDEEDLMKRKRLSHQDSREEIPAKRKPDLRSRLGGGNQDDRYGKSATHLSTSRTAKHRRTQRERRRNRRRSESPISDVDNDNDLPISGGGNGKYEKLTIQVDPDDV